MHKSEIHYGGKIFIFDLQIANMDPVKNDRFFPRIINIASCFNISNCSYLNQQFVYLINNLFVLIKNFLDTHSSETYNFNALQVIPHYFFLETTNILSRIIYTFLWR